MSSYNHVVLVGRLTDDPDLRHTQAGKSVANFRLAVNRPGTRNEEGRNDADFFAVQAWEKTAEAVKQYASKGRLALVEGRLQNRSYQAQDGSTRHVTEIVASNVRLLDSKRQDGEQGDGQRQAQPPARQQPAQQARPAAPTSSGYGDDYGHDDLPF